MEIGCYRLILEDRPDLSNSNEGPNPAELADMHAHSCQWRGAARLMEAQARPFRGTTGGQGTISGTGSNVSAPEMFKESNTSQRDHFEKAAPRMERHCKEFKSPIPGSPTGFRRRPWGYSRRNVCTRLCFTWPSRSVIYLVMPLRGTGCTVCRADARWACSPIAAKYPVDLYSLQIDCAKVVFCGRV
jgi:hypothetical protein